MRDNRDRRGMRQGRMRDDRDERANRDNRMDRQGRQGRDRYADRSDRFDRQNRDDRRMRADERQDNLVAVAGIVDVLDSYAFIRTSGYLPGPNDVYVSMSQVRKYGLRKGDAVRGYTRANNNNDGGNNRNNRNAHQKFVPLQSLETINGMSVEEAAQRPQFSKLTPLYPQERLRMETTPNRLVGRMIDLCAPIGKGQRGLIVSPPKAGKTITLQQIANAITTNNPEVHLMVVLVDERPEEVTDMQRTVQGEIISSTFDRPASDHTIVAELAIERAKRLVELGQDVVVLLDSMTRLARAYNIAAPASGRILSGGVDAQALYPPKKFFGAARNIENGGSLTIIASALVETGSKMDEVIFEEFKGTGNMELRLSRELAEKRMFPAIDINASGTRREELITDPKELMIIYRLRRALGGMEVEQAYNAIVPRMKKTASNRDFLAALASGQNPAAVPSA
jgi:transcription termination factor Rho